MTFPPIELADAVEEALMARACGRGTIDLAMFLRGSDGPRHLAAIEDALGQMRRRKRLLGASYPFGDGDDVVVPSSATPDGPYAALLLLSRLDSSQIERGNQVLDRFGALAVQELLGPGSQTVVFAWPPRLSEDPRPEEFSAAVHWLGERLGLKVGKGYRAPTRKDGGVDLVGVRPLGGSALASPVYLVQTTLSRDTRTKARDIDLGLWRTWLDLGPAATPCLAVPHEVGPALEELHASGMLVLDRVRICELLRNRIGPGLERDQTDWLAEQWALRAASLKESA